jgi:hypothetical protein
MGGRKRSPLRFTPCRKQCKWTEKIERLTNFHVNIYNKINTTFSNFHLKFFNSFRFEFQFIIMFKLKRGGTVDSSYFDDSKES